jgi:hypothetical protein
MLNIWSGSIPNELSTEAGLVQQWVQSEGSFLVSAAPFSVGLYRFSRRSSIVISMSLATHLIFHLCSEIQRLGLTISTTDCPQLVPLNLSGLLCKGSAMTTEPFIESSEELFTPGQLVECIDDQVPVEALINIDALPKKGKTYTIREAAVCRNHTTGQFNQSIRLEEIVNPGMPGNVAEPFWAASRFRILAPEMQNSGHTKTRLGKDEANPITPEIFKEHAAQCLRFQELRNSSPGLAACIMWLEDWSTTRINDLPKVLKFLAEQKRRVLCLRYGFPASRGILKLFKNWEMRGEVVVERAKSQTCLLEIRKLLSIEPDAQKVLSSSLRPWLGDVQRMLYGKINAPFGYFPRSKLKEGCCDWLFLRSAKAKIAQLAGHSPISPKIPHLG